MEADSDSDEDDEETPPAKVNWWCAYMNITFSVYWMIYIFTANQGKKRPNDSASKTPVAAKKAKSSTPQKTGEAIVFTMYPKLS